MSQSSSKSDALKTLKEQAAFVSTLQQKKIQSKSSEMEKFLSHSIQKAKEKLQNVTAGDTYSKNMGGERVRHGENVNTMNFQNSKMKVPESGVSSSAVASALKCLQTKVSTLESQSKQNATTISKLEEQRERLIHNQSSLQSSKSQLQIEIVTLKAQIQTLTKRLKDSQTHKKTVSFQQDTQKQSTTQTIQKLQHQYQTKDKELLTKYEKKEKLFESNQREFDKKVQQMAILEKDLSHRERALEEKEREVEQMKERVREKQREESGTGSELYRMHEKYKEILEHNSELERKVELGKTEIFKLETQIEVLKETRQLSNEEEYLSKIERLEEEIHRLKDKNKYQTKIDALKYQNRKIIEELETVSGKLTRLEVRCKDEQREMKSLRSKYQDTKELMNQLVGKIKKLPSGVSQEFKFILVKVSKLDKEGLRSDRSYSKINFSDTKSERVRSNSKSVRSTKKKPLKLQDLDKSRQSSRSRSISKSREKRTVYTKVTGIKIDNTYLKSSPLKSQRKRSSSVTKHAPISNTSTTSINISEKELRLSSDMNELEKIILNIKKEYKTLMSRLNDSLEGDDPEILRDRLNQLNEDLQMKTEQMADLRIKFRNL